MSVEIHVACRRDPSAVAEIFESCPVALVEVRPAATVRGWSPRAHNTVLLRERDVARVVTFHCNAELGFASEYAALVARTFEGVAVVDGEVVEIADRQTLSPAELTTAWNLLDGHTSRVLDERQADKQKRRAAYERTAARDDGKNRDYSTH
jgi:hypothetical protein